MRKLLKAAVIVSGITIILGTWFAKSTLNTLKDLDFSDDWDE